MSEKKATLKMMTEKDIEACLERIYKAFDEKNASDLIDAVVRRDISLGAAAMADEIIHGDRGEKAYEEMREDARGLGKMAAIGYLIDSSEGSIGFEVEFARAASLLDILKEVRG